MRLAKLGLSVGALCLLAFAGCAQVKQDGRGIQGFRSERNRQVGILVAQATPNSLAAAALLAVPHDLNSRRPLDLIEEAERLAPERPEILWLHLAICQNFKCDAKAQIAARIQTLDPDNGLVWASDLEQAQSSGPDAMTAVIARIGTAPRMTFYWNQLEVMMVDALGAANPSQSLYTRGVVAIGILAAEAIPPLQPLSKACQGQQLDVPGRRTACELMVRRMEQSSSVLTQSLGLDLQQRWLPAGSPQIDALRAKRRRVDYLMTVSARTRWWRLDRDMAVRIDAARRTEREEDVELAVVKSLGLPPEPPLDWKDSLHSD
jgi:hypothetical protein